mgnify:CR=1 FL=1|tara:strand:+ start:2205 stop:2645 length:441 start_codon:yes stop_codon:yes gene_type:complete
MTAFDQAWALLKAPIDWDSYQEDMDGVNNRVVNVDYVNPKEGGKRFPMTAWDYNNPFSPGIDASVNNPEGENVADAYLRYEGDDSSRVTVDRMRVNEANRRQGINTAMHQLMERLLQEKMNQQIEPSDFLSEDAKRFYESDWRDKE